MSDYLQALVERARGEARSVQPRLASSFARALPLEVEVEVDAPLARAPVRERAAPARAMPPPGRVEVPAPAGTTRDRSPERPTPEPVTVTRPEPSHAAESARQPAPGRAEPTDAVETFELPAQESAEITLIEHEVRETQAEVRPLEPVTVEVERMVEQPSGKQIHSEYTHAPASPEGLGPTGPPAAALADEAAAIESEPETVVVSIARIELHAAAPPPPQSAPARTQPGPRLSLDDYLRERNGRQR